MREIYNLIKKIPLVDYILKLRRYSLTNLRNYKNNVSVDFSTIVKNSSLGRYVTLYKNVVVRNCKIDDFVYVAKNTSIQNATIGKFCSIGSNVTINLGIHPISHISTSPIFYSTKKQLQISFTKKNIFAETSSVVIENDVWIGNNVMVMGNVKISNGAIIAAGSVVTKDVKPYEIVGGIPSRHIKYRFTQSEIDDLLEISWWNKDLDWLKINYKDFSNKKLFFKNNKL